MAIFASLSNGVDGTLIRHFAGKIDHTDNLYKTTSAKLSFWQNFCNILILAIGAPIGNTSYRAVIAASALPYLIAGVISIFIHDDSEKLQTNAPHRDFCRIAKQCLKDPKMRLRIMVRIFSRESTHVMLWLTTPIMKMAGVPDNMIVLPWIINAFLATLGSQIGGKYIKKLSDWQLLAIPTAIVLLSTGVLSFSVNLWTAPLFLLMGIVQGWSGATLKRLPEQYAKKSEQTSVSSFASTVGRLLYAATGLLVNYAADFSYSLAAFATLILFVPICILLTVKLKRE